MLEVEVLQQAGRAEELAVLLRRMREQLLDSIAGKLSRLDADSTAGWDLPEDPETLRAVLALLRPELETDRLHQAESAVWPELRGEPDFAPEMARLSHCAGLLAELEAVPETERTQMHHAAALLGHPGRLTRHLQREECWFWTQEAPTDANPASLD